MNNIPNFINTFGRLGLAFIIGTGLYLVCVPSHNKPEKAIYAYCGTAFYVAPHLVVTAQHVVGNAKYLWREDHRTGQIFTPILNDSDHDDAILYTDRASNSWIRLGEIKSYWTAARVLGYPEVSVFGNSLKIHRGTARYAENSIDQVDFNIDIWHGNSGGPILDENNNVIGIVTVGIHTGEVQPGGGSHDGYGPSSHILVDNLNKTNTHWQNGSNGSIDNSVIYVCRAGD